MLIGRDGPAVVLDARTCAFLERYAGLAKLRIAAAADRHVAAQLVAIRDAAATWRGSATGTTVATKPEPAASSQWLSTSEAAELLAVGPRAVVKAIARGRIPATRAGGRWRISREDLEHERARCATERSQR